MISRRAVLASLADRLLPHLSMDVTADSMDTDEDGTLTYRGVRPIRAWLFGMPVPVRVGNWITDHAVGSNPVSRYQQRCYAPFLEEKGGSARTRCCL